MARCPLLTAAAGVCLGRAAAWFQQPHIGEKERSLNLSTPSLVFFFPFFSAAAFLTGDSVLIVSMHSLPDALNTQIVGELIKAVG